MQRRGGEGRGDRLARKLNFNVKLAGKWDDLLPNWEKLEEEDGLVWGSALLSINCKDYELQIL